MGILHFDAPYDKSNEHNNNREEANNYQTNDSGVLADVVDTHVKANQDHGNG